MRNLENTVNNIRSFNRLYTNMLGLLDKHMLDTEFSLTEIRILYEIANNDNCTAGMLVKLLKVDKSYLSRIISKFVKKNLIFKEFSDQNSRVAILELTNSGKKIVDEMNEKSSKQITKLISNLDDNDYAEIDQAINTLKKKLFKSASDQSFQAMGPVETASATVSRKSIFKRWMSLTSRAQIMAVSSSWMSRRAAISLSSK